MKLWTQREWGLEYECECVCSSGRLTIGGVGSRWFDWKNLRKTKTKLKSLEFFSISTSSCRSIVNPSQANQCKVHASASILPSVLFNGPCQHR